MRSALRIPTAARGHSGFILPGVVMFILVLTIIGLSLFALSSYEAQFFYTSLHDTQLFYDASGAIDRARFVLGATKKLESVGANLGPGIEYAVARQGADSIGGWDDNSPIMIRVLATKTDASGKIHRRFQEALFDPNTVEMYDKLFSMSSTERGLRFMDDDNSALQSILKGTWWQTYAGEHLPDDWRGDVYDVNLESVIKEEVGPPWPPVPAPQVQTFLNQNTGNYKTPPEPTPNHYVLDASGAPDRLKFFSTANLNLTGQLPVFSVTGIAVWMFSQRLETNKMLTVSGTANDMLVLVVHGTASEDSIAALTLWGGIDSPNVPVILVSDHRIYIQNQPDGDFDTTVNWLSLYAPSAWIWGPKQISSHKPETWKLLRYTHGFSASAEANLETLFARRALPNVTGPRNALSFRPGSWREVTESNPY